MGAEDFSFMLNERPGAYIFLGNGDTAMVHHPAYNFDDQAIPFGQAGMPAWPRRGCRPPEAPPRPTGFFSPEIPTGCGGVKPPPPVRPGATEGKARSGQ